MEPVSDVKDSKRQGVGTQTINIVAEAEDVPICWICLDGPQPEKPLIHPCRCPSFCHAPCIARWQLQSAGTRREKYCDFCSCQLPDWKAILTPCGGAGAPAVMNVNFDNKTYSFQVSPGADGYRQFTEAIRKAFHLPDDSELNITFTCDEPSSAGALLTLSGPGAYDAAVHCASVSAARRVVTPDQQQQQQGGMSGACMAPGSNSGPAATTTAAGGGSGSGPASLLPLADDLHPISSHRISSNSSEYSGLGGSSISGSELSDLYDEAAGSSSGSSGSSGGSSSEGPSSSEGSHGAGAAGGGGGESVEGEQEDGSMSDGSARSSRSSSSSRGRSRRGAGLGRKLRNAISDLLVIR